MTDISPSSWRILVTGITSIHGWPIFRCLQQQFRPDQLYGIRPPQSSYPADSNCEAACVTDCSVFTRIQKAFAPTHVIHAAGVCDLDVCEQNPQRAYAINGIGTKNIVDVFGATSYIMYLSADLVFSGIHPPKNGYSEHDEPCPVSVVGKTYLAAEREMQNASSGAIVRIGLPMGDSIQREKGAIDFIENRFKRNLPMTLFYDELRSCLDCDELADIIVLLLRKQEQGLFHCGGPKPVSLYDIGEWLINRGDYNPHLLKRCSRCDDINGPPRIGNVHLNSGKLEALLKKTIQPWPRV